MRDYQDKERNRFYKKMNDEQKELFHSIQDNIFTFCEAKSGTGKTTVSVASAIDLLYQGKVSKVIYIQTCSARFLDLGFLPGTLEEKTSNLYIALYDALTELGFGEKEIEEMTSNGQLITMTDNALRGCNLEDAAIILDETQNCGYHTLKLILTRIHDNCHVVMLGDHYQKDQKGDNKVFIGYGEYLAQKIGKKVELIKNYRGRLSNLAEDYIC